MGRTVTDRWAGPGLELRMIQTSFYSSSGILGLFKASRQHDGISRGLGPTGTKIAFSFPSLLFPFKQVSLSPVAVEGEKVVPLGVGDDIVTTVG